MQAKYIGNIITNYRKDKFSPFFNITSNFSERVENIPTLIVGLEEARENIDNFSILEKKYNNGNIWWTYRKNERKYEYDKDLELFYDFCFNIFLSSVKYFYIDLPKYGYDKIKRLYNWIKSKNLKYCFLTRDSNFIFIYDIEKNIVFGLSLTLCEYMGVERKKIISLIKSNRKNRFIHDTSFINSDTRSIIGSNTHYILPLATILTNG